MAMEDSPIGIRGESGAWPKGNARCARCHPTDGEDQISAAAADTALEGWRRRLDEGFYQQHEIVEAVAETVRKALLPDS
jgi:hypothetical protein